MKTPTYQPPQKQSGVVLVIALIMLVVLSVIATSAVKSTLSGEVSTNNSRTHGLAMQAAEAGLRHCEKLVQNFLSTTPVSPNLQPAAAPTVGTAYNWENVASNWDSDTGFAAVGGVVLASTDINNSSTEGLYKRFPECMAQYLETPAGGTSRFVVTARGFGPDVPALTGTSRPKPIGSEVWLQSTNTFTP